MNLAVVAPNDIAEVADHRIELLDWMASQNLFGLSIQQDEAQLLEKHHRFAITAEQDGQTSIRGFGRSVDKLTAATIASAECIERYVSRKLLKEGVRASSRVIVEHGVIKTAPGLDSGLPPSKGLHSSNGWAVHFSRELAIQNAAREALERHILLLSFIKYGWQGFHFSKPLVFQDCTVMQGIAPVKVGGFGAGIVLTRGAKAPGATFGYICERQREIETSKRWLGAFFESHEQWADLTSRPAGQDCSILESYQRHYLDSPLQRPEASSPNLITQPRLAANLAVLDLQEMLKTSFPLFAAFAFGGNLVPLFLKQKLGGTEIAYVKGQLAKNGCEVDLPEFHPIL